MNFLNIDSVSSDWKDVLIEEFSKKYICDLDTFLFNEEQSHKVIYPKKNDIFTALKLTPLNKVKVVIIGQDPYHGENQAHGLSFSVQKDIKIPPSLKNIYKEIENELGHEIPEHGSLVSWAKEGVLLLNAVLTVEATKAGSHQKKGWENFTDKIVDILNSQKKNLVFILWGGHAQKKCKNIDESKHLVLKGPHPSPLSVYRGFFGCNHFIKANEYLVSKGKKAINWKING